MSLVYTSEDVCDNVSHEEVIGTVRLASSRKGLVNREQPVIALTTQI